MTVNAVRVRCLFVYQSVTYMDNYIVSARKYRPSTFDSVVGQSALTTTLKNSIVQGKLAHAYLFCGPRGVGKTTCARIFAKSINCLNPKPGGEACNECESCRAFNEQRSYNINELDAASNNSVDDIRGLIEQVQIPPQIGKYKVFIIDEVHMLTPSAFNAFLKTLEEPPAHAIFILATTEKHKILPTILSRCQIYDFARMTVPDTVKYLEYVAGKEGIRYDTEALHVIAEKADGGMRDALSIFDRVVSFCAGDITYAKVIRDLNVLDYDEYFSMTDHILKGEISEMMVSLDRILSKGFEANYFISGLASHFRNLLMARDGQTVQLLETSERVRQRYQEQAMRCQPKVIFRALRYCNDCDLNYRASNNKRLLVELTLIEVAQAATGQDDDSCGRRPILKLKPLFNAAKAARAASDPAAPHPAVSTPAAITAQPLAREAVSDPVHQPAVHPAVTTGQQQPATPSHGIADLFGNTNRNPVSRQPLRTFSITKMREQYRERLRSEEEAGKAAKDKENENFDLKANLLRSPFNLDTLTYHWFRYANEMPRTLTATACRMKGMKLTISPDYEVEVTVENHMVEDAMQDIKVSLQSYLRTQLRNDYIKLRFVVAAADAPHRPFTRLEKFQDMLERSEALRMLTRELKLELA